MGHKPDIKRYEKRIKKVVKKGEKDAAVLWRQAHDALLGKHTMLEKAHDLEKKAHALTKAELKEWEKDYHNLASRVKGIVEKIK
jgi:hypothetical protein